MLSSYVGELEARLGSQWDHLRLARVLSEKTESQLRRDLAAIDSEDTSVVVSGSLARGEFTSGSDIDWTLLIDGQADPNVLEILPPIEEIIRAVSSKPPGREGTFARPVYSHDLIHQIGGEDDTNRNTTWRILLLLESCALGKPDAYERVVTGILSRYISEDDGSARRQVPCSALPSK